MATDQFIKPDVSFNEAPASWNTRYITPNGFTCQITLRGESGKDLLERAEVALTFLQSQGYRPETHNNHSSNNHHRDTNQQDCPIHHVPMKRYEKDGRTWYSHRTENGGWCNGKQPRNGGSHE